MRAFVVASLIAACRAEASLPLAYNGYALGGAVLPYASHGALAAAHSVYGAPLAAAHSVYRAPLAAAAPLVSHVAPAVAVEAAPAVAVTHAAAPAVTAVATPAVPTVHSSQYRAGDEFGNNAFGYSNINSARQEQGNANGVTGSYSYVDEAGHHQVNYVADAFGYRVLKKREAEADASLALAHHGYALGATTYAHAAPLAATYAHAAPLAATYAHAAPLAATYAHAAPLAATYAAAPVAHATYAAAPVAHATYAAAPVAHATYAAAPVAAATYAAAPVAATTYAAAAPAARDAVLTTIKLNPGHATFYRVD